MQNEMMQNEALNGVGFLLGMFWVLALGAAMLVAYIGRRTNERKEQTYGYELEVLKTAHKNSEDANHSLARFLTKVRGSGGWEAYYEGYNHNTRTHTKLVSDSSLTEDEGGVEIVSPPLTGMKERRKWLSSVASKLDGLVRHDRSCSSHLHLGLKGPSDVWGHDETITWEQAKTIATKTSVLYTVFKDVFNSLVPRSRWYQTYTKPATRLLAEARHQITHLRKPQTEELWAEFLYDYARDTRYYHVNINSLSRYGTVEFRQHAGSINEVKLDAWAQLCTALLTRAAHITHGEMKAVLQLQDEHLQLDDLAHFLGLSPRGQLMTYFARRIDVLRGIPLRQKCTTCSRDDCAGCVSTQSMDWDEIHSEYFASAFGLGLLGVAMTFGPAVAALALVVGCGIGAIHSRGKQYDSGKTSSQLWEALESRGSHAAGVAWIDEDSVKSDGTVETFWYFKEASAATAVSSSLKRFIKPTTAWTVFHTRFSTHGKNTDDNAHPHFSSCGTVMLVHNGVVGNYMDVWDALAKHGRKQTGPVDSQAVCEALAVGGIDEVVKHCVGPMSLIWADAKDPSGTLHFWTNGENPLHFGRLDNPSGDIMVASTEELWLQAAGKRAITEPKRVAKTRTIKTKGKGKWAYPIIRTEQVKDRRGRTVYHTVQKPVNHWAAMVGKHYTIQPNGTIDGVMVKDWEDSTRGTMLSWRSYALPPKKATGNADTCALPAPVADAAIRLTDTDVHQTPFDICDKTGGWPSFIGSKSYECHGYDCIMHQGITPEGERYNLPQYCQPWVDDLDRAELLRGEFWTDPVVPTNDYYRTALNEKWHWADI